MKREADFQHALIAEIKDRWPTALVLKNDANYIQGIPDLTVFYHDRWAMLECKRSANEPHQKNQDYFVAMLNGMSFARFIYPENMEDVLFDMDSHFGS